VGPVTALEGVCLQDVERGAHEGGKRPLASRLRAVSSKATHPPTYLSPHNTCGVGGCELEVGGRLLRWSVGRSSTVLLYLFVKCIETAWNVDIVFLFDLSQSLHQKPFSQPKQTVTPNCYLFHGQVVPD